MVFENRAGVSTSSAASLTRMPVVWMRAPGSRLASITTVRKPAKCRGAGADEARKTRAHDDQIDVLYARRHVRASGVTLSEVSWCLRFFRISNWKP